MYEEFRDARVGVSKYMNNGILATCVAYRNSYDIDVEFEDGTNVSHRNWYDFEKGYVGHPLVNNQVSLQELIVAEYFKTYGFSKAHRCSLKHIGFNQKELDLYNGNLKGLKIAIEYDGGRVDYHTEKRDSKKNNLCEANNILLFRIREPQLEKYTDNRAIFLYRTSKRDNNELLCICDNPRMEILRARA